MGDLNGAVRVFDYISPTFALKYRSSVPHYVNTVKVENNNLMVAGSQYIRFYEWNGTDYEFISMLSDASPGIGKIGISNDFQRLAYGVGSISIMIRQRNAVGGYDIISQDNIFQFANSAIVDESGLYYIFATNDDKIRTYFECPSECASCSFPNNCSACQ